MLYSTEPPFQIISTRLMDAATILRMTRFAKFWDLIANSGNFKRSLFHEGTRDERGVLVLDFAFTGSSIFFKFDIRRVQRVSLASLANQFGFI